MTGTLDALSLSARVGRKATEEHFGERLRAWIVRGGARYVDVVHVLGVSRNDLDEALAGKKHVRAAWMELLPPSVELLYLAERAAHHGLCLAVATGAEAPFSSVVGAIGEVLARCSESEASGVVRPDDGKRDAELIRALIRKLEAVANQRERAGSSALGVSVAGKR